MQNLDLALIGVLTYFLVQTAIKPILAHWFIHATGVAFDAVVPLLTALAAAGFICLDVYAPGAFLIAKQSAEVASGAVGAYHISKNKMPAKREKKPPQVITQDVVPSAGPLATV